jgi:hypothetical protein
MTDDKYILSRAIRRVHPSVTRRAGALSHPTLPKCKLAIPLRNHSAPLLAVGRNSNQQSVRSLPYILVCAMGKSFSGPHRSSVIRRSSRRTRSPRSSSRGARSQNPGARRFVGVPARRELQSHWSHRSHESHLFAAPDGVPELNVADTPSALLTPEF